MPVFFPSIKGNVGIEYKKGQADIFELPATFDFSAILKLIKENDATYARMLAIYPLPLSLTKKYAAMKLRDYQKEAIETVANQYKKRISRQLIVLPTGTDNYPGGHSITLRLPIGQMEVAFGSIMEINEC